MIKYKEGFVSIAGYGSEFCAFPLDLELRIARLNAFSLPVIPKPYQLWKKQHVQSIFPLMMVLSFAWALEM